MSCAPAPASHTTEAHHPEPSTAASSSSTSISSLLPDYDVEAATAILLAKVPTHDASGQPLSKNASKRLRKQAHLDALKPLRRAKEKQQKKAKLAARRQLVKPGALADDHHSKNKSRGGAAKPFGARIVIDCGFDDLMNEKEVKSMAAQLGFCYSTNRTAARPFDLLVTSFDARLRAKFDSIEGKPHNNWRGVEWWDDSWEGLWAAESSNQAAVDADELPSTDSSTELGAVKPASSSSAPPRPKRPRTIVSKSSIVYLTGDSPNILSTLTPGETYILGGIVDHNRYKHLCLDRAERAGVRHAQLPIGQHMPALRTRKVLTVNQVYSILVNYAETLSWSTALESVMPQRKLVDSSTKVGSTLTAVKADEGNDDNNDTDDEGGDEIQDDSGDGTETGTGTGTVAVDPRAGSKQAKRRRAREAQAQQGRRSLAEEQEGVYVVIEESDSPSDGGMHGDLDEREYEAKKGPVPERVAAEASEQAN